jgi:hypothetical protein
VSGRQAAVLYGAAHFSQDLNLWIDPTEENIRRFVDALEEVDARVHKLTPALAGTPLKCPASRGLRINRVHVLDAPAIMRRSFDGEVAEWSIAAAC